MIEIRILVPLKTHPYSKYNYDFIDYCCFHLAHREFGSLEWVDDGEFYTGLDEAYNESGFWCLTYD